MDLQDFPILIFLSIRRKILQSQANRSGMDKQTKCKFKIIHKIAIKKDFMTFAYSKSGPNKIVGYVCKQ